MNPYQVVISFEEALAEFCGSKYAVCVESCTSAIFLSLMWYKHVHGYKFHEKLTWDVGIPNRTYPGVACSIIHSGGIIRFKYEPWEGEYELEGYDIWDAALRFKRGMFHGKTEGAMQCLSFHQKKNLPIGRGGAILTNDFEAVKWLRRARFDGRNPVPLQEDYFDMLGWNCYLQPEQAARGLALMQMILTRYPDGPPDLLVEDQKYADLSLFDIYKQ